MTATYAQTHTYANEFSYKKEKDDDDCAEMNGDEHDDVNEPDSQT